VGHRLLDWQRKVLRDIYGTVAPESGLRRYRHGFVSVAKQNGKSFLFGGFPIYHLLMEDELNPEAYDCAAAKDQAGIVFKAAARLVNANSDLRTRLRLLEVTFERTRVDGWRTFKEKGIAWVVRSNFGSVFGLGGFLIHFTFVAA